MKITQARVHSDVGLSGLSIYILYTIDILLGIEAWKQNQTPIFRGPSLLMVGETNACMKIQLILQTCGQHKKCGISHEQSAQIWHAIKFKGYFIVI